LSISDNLKNEIKKDDVKGIKLVFSLALSDNLTLEKKDWNIEILQDGLVATKKDTKNINFIPFAGRLSYIHLIKE
jgi:hypothetical protein